METVRGCGALAVLFWLGCGLTGSGGGPVVDSWPQSGLSGFSLLTSDQAPDLQAPFVLLAPGIDTDEPAAAADEDSDPLLLWVSAKRRGGTDGSFIGQARAPVLEQGAMDLVPALSASAPWEQGGLRRPALLRGVPGLPPYLLLYQGMDGSVGAAIAGEDLAWRKVAGPLLDAARIGGAVDSMGAVLGPGVLRLYLLVDGFRVLRAEADLDAMQQALLDQGQGQAVTWRLFPALLSAADFSVPQALGPALPAQRISGLSARRLITPAGRERFDLFLVAETGDRQAVCAASSYDGVSFLAVPDPILGKGGGMPSSPTAITYRKRALLLLGLHSVQTGIAAARIP